MKTWARQTAIGVSSVALIGAVYVMTDQSRVFDYGDPASSYMKPDAVYAGGWTSVCFDDVTWLRLCPSTLKWWLIDANGKRNDYDDATSFHRIFPPAKAGKLIPKCRAWQVPFGLPPGPTIQTGVVVSRCSLLGEAWAVRMEFPKIKFTVKPEP